MVDNANAACMSMSAGRGAPSSCRAVVGDAGVVAGEAAVSRNQFCPQSLLNLSYLDVPAVELIDASRVGKAKKRVTFLVGTRRSPYLGKSNGNL